MAVAAAVVLSANFNHLLCPSTTEKFLPWTPDHERRSLRFCWSLGINGYLAKGRTQRRRCNALPFRPCNVNTPGIEDGRIKINNLCGSPYLRCHCFGSISSYDGATTPEFVTLVDQILLMASIFLTYAAGVVPPGGKQGLL